MAFQSVKQQQYRNEANHRWNVKTGATRAGKTYGDYFLLPKRILSGHGREGLNVILGNTKGTLQRNLMEPMQAIWGAELVSSIRSDNTATMFGELVHCLGADNARHVDRIRGMSIKYCYGDEVVTWHPDVFEMLKSRLDKPYSLFDGTCNPSYPEHWFKGFLDSDADVYVQRYTIDDNPFLAAEFVANLKREYTGTVYYGRYILGEWVRAEGLVFGRLADEPNAFVKGADGGRGFTKVVIGIDFGGNGSRTCFCATGYMGYERLNVLAEDALPVGHGIDAADICERFVAFERAVLARFARVDWVLGDSASPTMINSLVSAARGAGLPWRNIAGCRKNAVSQRPLTVDRLLGQGRLSFAPECTETLRALTHLCWDAKKPDQPEDLNVGNINDRWDAFCYTWLDFVELIDRR